MTARSRCHGEEACRLWRTTKRRTSSIGRETTEVRREEETQERSGTESQVVRRSTAQLRNKQCASIKGCGAQEICKGVQCQDRSHECRLTCRMSCAKKLSFSSKGSKCQDWSAHDCVLSHSPKIVISEWRLSMLRHVLPRFALNVLCHSRTAPMVPQRSQKWARLLFWFASSIQRDVAPIRG